MTNDDITHRWIRNKADERAVAQGCAFSWKRGAFVVWWIERFLRLYEGAQAGEPMRMRGLHNEPEWDIPREWNDVAERAAYRRMLHYLNGRERGEPADWQYEATMRLFGWVRHDAFWKKKIRRFRKAQIYVPKKNKKSPTMAAWSLYVTCGDGEPGNKAFTGAKDGNQAREIAGKHVIRMVQSSPELSAICKINLTEMSVTHLPSLSEYKPLSSATGSQQKAKEGLNGSLFVDETHVVDRDFISRLSRMGISRKEPLQIEVSTAGNDPDAYGKEMWDYGLRVNAGDVDDIQTLFMSYHCDQKLQYADLTAESVMEIGRRCNPAWGHTINPDEFLTDFRTSARTITAQNDFLMYRLNQWQHSTSPWLMSGVWEACGADYTLEDLRGQSGVIGLDLSESRDFTGVVAAIPEWTETGLDTVTLWPVIIAPRAFVEKHRGDAPFDDWIASGHLRVSPGNVIDQGYVYGVVSELAEILDLYGLGYDRWRGEALTQIIEQGITDHHGQKLSDGLGIPRYAVGQVGGDWGNAIDAFEARVIAGKIRHPRNSVLTWMINHAKVRKDGKYTSIAKPDRTGIKKIDGVSASIIAVTTVEKLPRETVASHYDTYSVEFY